MEINWYTIRCVFRHKDLKNSSKKYIYEERITLWQSESFEKAIVNAEEEAKKYAEESGCRYTGLSQAFKLLKDDLNNGAELFSLMRESDLESKKYLDFYFDTGDEKQDKIIKD